LVLRPERGKGKCGKSEHSEGAESPHAGQYSWPERLLCQMKT
jgi:hypothetical protein